MAWKTPQTWSSGQGIWVYDLNREVRDRMMTLRNANDNLIRLSLTSAQQIPDSQHTPIRWDTLDWAASGGSSLLWTGGAPLLAPYAGWYEFDMKLCWSSGETTGGTRFGRYTISNATNVKYDITAIDDYVGTRPIVHGGLGIVQLTTADSLEVGVYQNTGDDLTLLGSTGDRSRCTWRLLGGTT